MRTIMMSLILGLSVAAVASPALAGDEDREPGTIDQFVATPDRETPQINLAVVAGPDEQPPAVQERYEKN